MAQMKEDMRTYGTKCDDPRISEEIWYRRAWIYQGEGVGEDLQQIR